jgi:hypothetical protein
MTQRRGGSIRPSVATPLSWSTRPLPAAVLPRGHPQPSNPGRAYPEIRDRRTANRIGVRDGGYPADDLPQSVKPTTSPRGRRASHDLVLLCWSHHREGDLKRWTIT